MKEKFQTILDKYYDNKISLDDFIYNIKILHREKIRLDTKKIQSELHPKLQEILPILIKNVEKKTDLIYYGIYDSFEGYETNLKHYHIKFQHKLYFAITINLSYGQGGSCNKEYYVRDDNKIHFGITTGGFQAAYGECDINDNNLLDEIFSIINRFNEKCLEY